MLRDRAVSDRGAAIVEFAIVLPIFMMLVLGMFTGGLAYNQKITITNATREASRYGATLPVDGDLGTWLAQVAKDVRDNATGELDDGVGARRICVAYVHPAGTAIDDQTSHVVITAGSIPASVTPSAGRCTRADGSTYNDGVSDGNQRRVNVVVSRASKIEALLFSRTLTLEAASSTRFEAVE